MRNGHVPHPFASVSLDDPKGKEKAPFRTYDQIEAIVKRGNLSKQEQRDLWAGLFLDWAHVDEILEYVRMHTTSTWLYPFFVVIAHTGARRSELLRARIEDFDFEHEVVLVREKKKFKERETFRTVDMIPLDARAMREYFAEPQPGGVCAFSPVAGQPVDGATAREAYKWLLRNSRWKVLRGYHAIRQSFASNLAAVAISSWPVPRLLLGAILDSWAGGRLVEAADGANAIVWPVAPVRGPSPPRRIRTHRTTGPRHLPSWQALARWAGRPRHG